MTSDTDIEAAELRRLLRAESIKVVALRTMLQELIDRRKRVADEYQRMGFPHERGATKGGSDGRYERAQDVVDANPPLNHGERLARTDDPVPPAGG